MLAGVTETIDRTLWRGDPARFRQPARAGIQSLRVAYLLFADVMEGPITLQAMSLVYTTLLSMVPLLAVSFSVLKAFGVHNLMEPILLQFTAPLGAKGDEVVQRILSFVENMQVGVLGSVGLAFLLYTVVSLIQKIEDAFNSIWHVSRPRSFTRRFSDYLSVLLVGPVLVFSAIGLTASITSNAVVQRLLELEPFGTVVLMVGQLAPFLFIIGAFTFVYLFVPNIRVRFVSALTGGAVAGSLWQLTGFAFASFAAGSTRYDAIYSGFAILILFMIWLYLSWLILLLGSRIAFLHQHPEQIRREAGKQGLSNREKELLGLMTMYLICGTYYRDGAPWTIEGLVAAIGQPQDRLDEVLRVLEAQGFVVAAGEDNCVYYPARPPERVTVAALLDALRRDGAKNGPGSIAREVEAVVETAEDQSRRALGGATLRDLVQSDVSRIER